MTGRQLLRNTGTPEVGIVYEAALGLGVANAPPTYSSVLVAASERTWLSTFGVQPLIRLAPVAVRLNPMSLPDRSPPANNRLPSGVTVSAQTRPPTLGLLRTKPPGHGGGARQGAPVVASNAASRYIG